MMHLFTPSNRTLLACSATQWRRPVYMTQRSASRVQLLGGAAHDLHTDTGCGRLAERYHPQCGINRVFDLCAAGGCSG